MFKKSFLIYFYSVILINYFDCVKTQDPCTTVNNQTGNCIFLTDCELYYNILLSASNDSTTLTSDQRKTISDSWCGTVEGKHKVCCPISTTQVTSNYKPIFENRDYSNHENVHLFHPNICGFTVEDKIFKGHRTDIFEFPWNVIIQYKTNNVIKQMCGGSVISKKYILTAAHCITNLKDGTTIHSVVLGEHDTLSDIDCYFDPTTCSDPIQTIEIESIISHPLYNKHQYENDIGLVRLKSEINFSESVLPICLPINLTTQQLVPKVKVTGWGITENGTMSPKLIKADFRIINNTHCNTLYSETSNLHIMQTHLCVIEADKSNTCPGDSGGPAVYQANPRYVQYGIVSYDTCGKIRGLPAIYTSVIPYMKWILDNMID